MKWDYISATEFCESVRDGTHDTPKPVEKGYKLVTGKHIRDGIIDPDDAYYISEKDFKKINERSRVNQWDVLMSMIGNGLGRSAVVRDEPDYAIKNIALFKVGNEIKAKWLHYYLAGPDGQGLIYASLQGSGQPFISLSYLRDFPIPNPPMNVMEKIVSIAEKYDELIDKNRKQIKLLEEAAQRLYKEWFVDLRFPGHEGVDIIDGVPRGWETKTIEEICERINAGGTPSRGKSNYWKDEDIIWYKTGELLDSWLIDSEEKISIEGLSNSSAKLFPKNTILMAIYASPTLGHLGILSAEACCNQASLCLLANERIVSWQWLYYKLFELRDEFNAIAKGAGQQNISADAVKKKAIVVPNKTVLNRFTGLVAPIFEKRLDLQMQNRNLAEARDRLLPKLMSGEIEL